MYSQVCDNVRDLRNGGCNNGTTGKLQVSYSYTIPFHFKCLFRVTNHRSCNKLCVDMLWQNIKHHTYR